MGATGWAQGGAPERFVVTEAERRVADPLPIDVDPILARAIVEKVPFFGILHRVENPLELLIYWGFTNAGLERLAQIAAFSRVESLVDVEVDGHPRIMGRLVA